MLMEDKTLLNGTDPDKMTPAQRLDKVAALSAATVREFREREAGGHP